MKWEVGAYFIFIVLVNCRLMFSFVSRCLQWPLTYSFGHRRSSGKQLTQFEKNNQLCMLFWFWLPLIPFETQSGTSRISQSLVGPLLGSRHHAGRHFVPQATARCNSPQTASHFLTGELTCTPNCSFPGLWCNSTSTVFSLAVMLVSEFHFLLIVFSFSSGLSYPWYQRFLTAQEKPLAPRVGLS